MFHLGMKEALKSVHHFRHGAVVVKGGAVLSVGYNNNGTHAEVNALKKLWPSKRKGCTVWSIRLTGSGRQIANAKPCEACLHFMREAGVKKVFYSTADREIEMIRLNSLPEGESNDRNHCKCGGR